MHKPKRSLIAFLGFAVAGVFATVMPHTGSGQALQGNGAVQLNCNEAPCDAVARGRAAFNDRNLNQLGGDRKSVV